MRKLAYIAAVPTVLLILGCGLGSTTSGSNPKGGSSAQAVTEEATKPSGHTIVLEVTGVSSADITFGVDVDQSQEQGAKVPWKKTLKATDYFAISLLAQNKGGGTIKCKITVDGKVLKENSSKGQYAIVTCNA